MRYGDEEHEAVRRAVEWLFREVASRFPHASVRTDIPGPGEHGLIELSCSLAGTTPVRVLPGADQIDLYLGENTWFELVSLDRVRRMVEAVVAGRFEEKVCVLGGKIVASRHILHRSDRPAAWRSRVRPIFLPGRRRSIRYRPYG